MGFLIGIVIIGRGDAAAFDTVALDPREAWRAVVVVGSIPTIPIDIAHIERMGSVGTDGDVDDVTVKGAQIIPVFGIAVVVIEEAQRRIDGLPLLQLQTAIELVVVDSFAPIGVRVEAIGEGIATLTSVTVLAEEVGAWSEVGDDEDYGGVLGVSVHILGGAPRYVGAFAVVGIEIEAAQTQRGLGSGGKNSLAIG